MTVRFLFTSSVHVLYRLDWRVPMITMCLRVDKSYIAKTKAKYTSTLSFGNKVDGIFKL